MALRRSSRRVAWLATTLTMAVIAGTAGLVVSAPSASAAETVLFNQPFHDKTVDGSAGAVALPAAQTGTNAACLTAAGNATANPLASCATANDTQGSGTLRLTPDTTNQVGAVFATGTVPTSQGLDITFNIYQYGTATPSTADGTGFVLAAVNPADPVPPPTAGPTGGSLGYSASVSKGNSGLTDGYVAVGFDEHGNFSNPVYEGSGCTNPANIDGVMAGQVVMRGPGNGQVGYCPLASTAATATSAGLTLRAATRAASEMPVEVVVNPTSSSITTPSGLVVPAGELGFAFTPVGGSLTTRLVSLPTVPAGLYPASWVSASGLPKELAFGWVGSTGADVDYHEIDSAVVNTLLPAPLLAVSQTSYAAATLSAGSPVTYTVAASSSGVTENSPVTVTETLPSGVVPVGASGPGWVCGAPSGQQISCTDSTSPFTSGTFTVNGIVTSGGVTPALIHTGSTAAASSSDGVPATSTTAPGGTVPAAPVVTAVTPASGTAGGNNGVTVSGTNLGGATAIEIGTAAEFAAGTPATLDLCGAPAAGCFTVTSSTSLNISSMPAHATGAVLVSVVSLGIASAGAYTYNPSPTLQFSAPPGGEVGVGYSDQLTVTGGTSPFTWSVSSGTLPAGVTLAPSTGLLSGTPTAAGSYTFTVEVTDAGGLTATESVSMTIIAGPSLNFPTPPYGETGSVYSDTLAVSGGTGPYIWSVSAGSLPAGITLGSATGTLAGTPTAVGTSHLHSAGHRCRRAVRDRGHLAGHHRRSRAELPRSALGRDRDRLQRHADRQRRHRPLHLVGQRGEPAGRDHPRLRDRHPGWHADRRRHVHLHGAGHRCRRAVRDRGHLAGHHRRSRAELPRSALGRDRDRLQRHADRQRRHRPLHLVGQQREPAGRDHPRLRDRDPGRNIDRRRHVHLHGAGHRCRRAVRDRGHLCWPSSPVPG